MMRKARLAIGKVNVALDSPVYYPGADRRLICSLRTFSLPKKDQVKRQRLVLRP